MSEVKNKILNDAIVKDVNDLVRNLQFGIISIKVHDSKIVQIEVTEKKRFDQIWEIGEGGGI